MIKAVIFDCFGVLTSDGWLPFKEKYFKNDPEKYDEATRLNALANGSKIPYAQFLTEVSQLAGVSVDVLNMHMHKSVPNQQIFELIKELRTEYKIGFLSNVSGDWLPELFSSEQLALFNATTLSSRIGHVKPNPLSYTTAAQELGCAPNECVFIDDQQRFVEGAIAVGMQAIHYESFDQAKNDLNRVLGVADADE